LKELSIPLPGAAIGFSPWVDLTEEFSKNSRQENLGIDFLSVDPDRTSVKMYCGSMEATANPLISPILGDLKDLPPILIQVGAAELIRDESIAFSEKLKEAGVDAKLEVFEDMVHVFQQFTFDSKAKLDW